MVGYEDGLQPDARRRLESRGWRLRHSLWMLAAFLGIGALSWVSLVYVAARTRRPKWMALAAAFVVAGGIAGFWPDDESNTAGGLLVFVWAAAIVTAFVLRPGYLRWRASQDLPAPRQAAGATPPGPQDTVPPDGGRPGATGPVFGADGRWTTPER